MPIQERSRPYQICTKTIMDTTDPGIRFDAWGVSNHYYEYQKQARQYVLTGKAGRKALADIVDEIKRHGKGRRYDSILGLSGGVDSTYLCLLARDQGLNPLVVHFDNGWNSELAVNNIENTVKRIGFDLFTYVCDWSEFRDLQRAYFKANVVDIEVLTDHGFMAALYHQARKHKIKYVLGGMNVVTEAILPRSWHFSKGDLPNILNIQRKFGTIPIKQLRSYPTLSSFRRQYLSCFLGMQTVCPLNFVDYQYEHVKSQVTEELGWRDYGGKHYESIFTRFYQGYILPRKFKIDKRRAHLSTLICSGQITREEALAQIDKPPYAEEALRADYPFVLKKLGFSESEFQAYFDAPGIDQRTFSSKTWRQKYPLLIPLRESLRRLS